MGYRSDVRIAVYGTKEEVTKFLVQYRMEHSEAYTTYVKEEIKINDLGDGDIGIFFESDNTKWYDDYGDVKAFNTLYEMAQDNDELSGEFVRIGEDAGDITEDSFGESRWIYSVTRHINCDYNIQHDPSLLGQEEQP
jgi:hypothetical protein